MDAMQRKLLFPTALAAVLALAACDKGITNAGTQNQLSRSDAQTLAGDFGDQDGAILDGFGGPAFDLAPGPQLATSTVTTTFTRTRTCPVSGDVKVEGTLVRNWDRTTQSGSIQFNATRTEEACAFSRNGATLTVNGNPNTQLTANQTVTNGTPGIRTATKKGSFTWTRSTGGSGTCNIDVTHTWDPSTKTLHVVGTLCNQTVDITRTWTQS
jgi:hypothetical protein